MSTYFKIINLDKKQRGMLATEITDAQAQELIKQSYEAGHKDEDGPVVIDFKKIVNSSGQFSWVKEHGGYLHITSKAECGAIYMEACSIQWGQKGEWFGDRVNVISNGYGSDTRLWNDSEDWPVKFFHIYHCDLCTEAREWVEEVNASIKARQAKAGAA